jgi:hypothetical protein
MHDKEISNTWDQNDFPDLDHFSLDKPQYLCEDRNS